MLTRSSLIGAVNFETDEALLTGESLPVRKEAREVFDDDTGPGDRLNIAYSSSTVTKGRARGVVFATGSATEIGQIASALQGQGKSRRREVKRQADGTATALRHAQNWLLTASDAVGGFLGVNIGTPLQRKLSKLAVLLFIAAIVCAIIVLGANNFSGQQEVVIYAVATGLSMLPASLIVVLTITMAAGTKRMVQRHVIVRNLKSLEALGAVTSAFSLPAPFPANLASPFPSAMYSPPRYGLADPRNTPPQTSALTRREHSHRVRWWSRRPGCPAAAPTQSRTPASPSIRPSAT